MKPIEKAAMRYNPSRRRDMMRLFTKVGVLSVFCLAVIAVVNLPCGHCRVTDITFSEAGCGNAAEIEQWSKQLVQAEEEKTKIKLLIKRGEAYRALGHYGKARLDFENAAIKADKKGLALLKIVAEQSTGYLFFLEGDTARAEPLLRNALEAALQADHFALAASCANRLGNILTDSGQHEEAVKSFQQALAFAGQADDDPALVASIHINLARVTANTPGSREHLLAAKNAADRIEQAEERARMLLEVGAFNPEGKNEKRQPGLQRDALMKAFTLAQEIRSDRLLSLASGYLGAIYERHERLAEARGLTEQAIVSAQRITAHDLLLDWEWQLGRIFKAQHQPARATDAFRRAVYHIQNIRRDIPIRYRDGRSSFRATLAPIYFGLADLLLQQASAAKKNDKQQQFLREARDTVELIKRSEIRDYFNDQCIDARTRQVESLASRTAVLYPIILPDRLEILVDIDNHLYQKTSAVTRTNLTQTVKQLAHCLRSPDTSYEMAAREIYDLLIQPVSSLLNEQRINTIVYAPDGALRMLPLAALWDGEHFLAEHYAVATVPGLTLLDPNPVPRKNLKTILGGMSKPGPVVRELPDHLRTILGNIPVNQQHSGVRGINTIAGSLSATDVTPGRKTVKQDNDENIQQALALPGVDNEIQQLSHVLESKVMMNSDFELDRFESDFENQDYRIVHIASHGFFGGSPEQTFIMTYDRLLDMNHLESLIKPKQLSARPVELIALSACQTAEGDDRSPLGLTGVALKSGARSGLGSLWPVSDEAAQELLPAFYIKLKDPGNSKAQALRQAQLTLIKQKRFFHPFFWSSFILVGNWL